LKSAATTTLTDSIASETFVGNDINQIDGSFEMFGQTGWTLSDESNDMLAGDPITFTPVLQHDVKSGFWGVIDWSGFTTGNVVITIKAGNGFTAFLVDTTSLTGFWSSTKDLSHASIYVLGSPPIVPTPLPAGFVLLLTAMGSFGFARYRSKRT
jgi:hypothetical protein